MEASTSHKQLHHVENDWTVTISVDGREEATRATARLQFGDQEWMGAGLSRLSPAERGVSGVGSQLAVARALSDLARRLTAVAGTPVTSLR